MPQNRWIVVLAVVLYVSVTTDALTLKELAPPVTVVPAKNSEAKPGTPAVYWAKVRCAGPKPTDVVGNCAWTGIYISNAGEGLVNYNVVCTLDQPCEAKGPTGKLMATGQALGVDSTKAVELLVVGGTGGYSSVKGGKMLWEAGTTTFTLM